MSGAGLFGENISPAVLWTGDVQVSVGPVWVSGLNEA